MKLYILIVFVLLLIPINSCDTTNAEWRNKYELEKIKNDNALMAIDSLEVYIGVLSDNITLLYNTSSAKIDSLKLIIAAFPDTNLVIARYKIIRDGQVIEMLGSVNTAVLNYVNLIDEK